MDYLFGASGLKAIEALFFTKTLFAFDFDGTLSPIVRDPERAKMGQRIFSLLSQLNEMVPVAVISGRSLSDLEEKMPIAGIRLVGNHGLEMQGVKRKRLTDEKNICQLWIKKIRPHIEALQGCEIEDKGYSLALHYRKSRKKKEARESLLNVISGWSSSPRVIFGKSVINLLPIGAPHKGLAMMELMQKNSAKAGFYIGDDDTDEDVFCLPNNEILTVRVGRKLNSHALFYIKSQAEVTLLLSELLQLCSKTYRLPER